jgi:hypothetical protein
MEQIPGTEIYTITLKNMLKNFSVRQVGAEKEPSHVWYLAGAVIAVLAVIAGAAVLYKRKHRGKSPLGKRASQK